MQNDSLILDSLLSQHLTEYNLIISNCDSIIYDLTHNITKRIDSIENSYDYQFWWPILITILLALINWLIVRYSYKKDKQRSILTNMSNEYDNTENLFLEISNKTSNKDEINLYLEKLLNKIEYMCYEFNKGNVSKTDFNHKFRNKIREYYLVFPEYYGDVTEYNDTIKYYKTQVETK